MGSRAIVFYSGDKAQRKQIQRTRRASFYSTFSTGWITRWLSAATTKL